MQNKLKIFASLNDSFENKVSFSDEQPEKGFATTPVNVVLSLWLSEFFSDKGLKLI